MSKATTMRSTPSSQTATIALALVMSMGCSSGSTGSTSSGASCTYTADCQSTQKTQGYLCISGTCQACTKDSDCSGASYYGPKSTCLLPEGRCTNPNASGGSSSHDAGTAGGSKASGGASAFGGSMASGGARSTSATTSSGGASATGTSAAGGSSSGVTSAGTSSFGNTTTGGTGASAQGGITGLGGTSAKGGNASSVTAAGSSGLGGVGTSNSGGVTATTGGVSAGGTTTTSTSNACPAGSAVSVKTGTCFTCSFTTPCGATGESGKVYPLTAVLGPQETCICETNQDFFYSTSTNSTEPCDKDQDGWVRDSAIGAMNDINQAVKDNMRCTVRMASQVVLHSESGDDALTLYFITDTAGALQVTTTAPGTSTPDAAASDTATAAALPLYESVRNDDDSKLQSPTDPGVPAYGTQHLTDSERNSLTKACVTLKGDHNDNSIPDVQEWARLPDQQVSGPTITDLRAPYVPLYNRFSYYVELNKGWFEVKSADANAKTETGIYHIQERSRAAAASDGLGIVAASRNGGDPYWRSCTRKVDSLYTTDTTVNPSTLDFASLDDTTWTGMLHHSQFKCIQAVDDSDPVTTLTDSGKKSQFYKQTVTAITTNSSWDVNSCTLGSGVAPTGPNPTTPVISCTVQSTPPVKDEVHWVAMSYQDYTTAGGYVRGCINECVASPPAQCHDCTTSSDVYGQATYALTPKGKQSTISVPTCSGSGQVCDGEGHCGICVPDATQCRGTTVQQVCTSQQTWQDITTCAFGCSAANGQCYPYCTPGTTQCSASGTPQSCGSSGNWQDATACDATRQCIGAGVCKLKDGQICSAPSDCANNACTTFYHDADKDGYYDAKTSICGTTAPSAEWNITSSSPNDCCDTDANAHPGQTAYFQTARVGCGGFDYNCDSSETMQYPTDEILRGSGLDACSNPECSCSWNSGANCQGTASTPGCGQGSISLYCCCPSSGCSNVQMPCR